MTQFQLIVKSFRHYFKSNLWVALGIAITTAVLAGGLIVGDSVKHSLFEAAKLRLGNISHALTSGDRYFTVQLGEKLNEQGIKCSAVLKLEAIASASGGQLKLNKVNVWGIDEEFTSVTGSATSVLNTDESSVSISKNIAQRLNLKINDEILLRITKASLIPANAPFVSDNEQTITYRTKVAQILDETQMGRISLQHSQTAPFNIFMPIGELNRLMDTESKANTLLLSTQKNSNEIENAIKLSYSLADAQLSIVEAAATGQWELRSERVFIDNATYHSVVNTGIEHSPVLTYFSNYFRLNGKETPYSFISSLPDSHLNPDEMVINIWLANDLGAQVGDTLRLGFFEIGPLRELNEHEKLFTINEIVNIDGYFADQSLMPQIPGLSDAENCRDWDTGVPVKLSAIRDKDEDYWYQYRGLPKAFVSIQTAQELWGNRFGKATAFRFDQFSISKEELTESITAQINPFALDFQVRALKTESLAAASQGTDFSQLFLGLSFFILVAALILTALLFRFNLENRNAEIGTLSSLGFSQQKIQSIYLSEGIIVSLAGAALGLILAIGYNKMVFWALNQVWNDIVRTEVLVAKIVPSTLIIGFVVSVAVAMITIHFTFRQKMKQQTAALQRRAYSIISVKKKKIINAATLLSFIAALVLVLSQLIGNVQNLNATSFFVAGGLLLLALIFFIYNYITKQTTSHSPISFQRITLQNIKLNRTRSITIVILLAIGAFLVVSTGLNRKDLFSKANEPTSGTGGFLYWMETTVPVLHNLNNADYRNEQGFSVPFDVVQMQVADGDDASCLNLNRISNPRILGLNAAQLEGRFSVQTKTEGIDAQNFWQVLTRKHNGCIPAIADQTVIQWGLGKKVGDTLVYRNALGDEVKLLLVAGLAGSVFQGNVLIDNSNFNANFPTNSGSNVFLIDGKQENKTAIADELNLLYRDFGIELTQAPQRLAEFMSVTNTYLSIFLILGALGLLIGTIGLGIVMQRSLVERKAEFALLKSVGFTNVSVFKLVTIEYTLLMLTGLLVGFFTAVISVYPVIGSETNNVSLGFVALLLTIILVNGVLWIALLAALQLRKLKIIEALRNE